jgi:Tfp pilus assembly protein PilV
VGSRLAGVGGVRRIAESRGFTLVESVIACTVLATALLSIGHLGAVSVTRVAEARYRTISTTLALAKLEELRADRMPSAGADVVDSTGQPADRGSTVTFERRWSITAVTAGAGIVTVVVNSVPAQSGQDVRLTGGWMAVR